MDPERMVKLVYKEDVCEYIYILLTFVNKCIVTMLYSSEINISKLNIYLYITYRKLLLFKFLFKTLKAPKYVRVCFYHVSPYTGTLGFPIED